MAKASTPTEHQEQAALFKWAALRQAAIPALRLMHAIPNGGHRHKAVAARLKREGVKAGIPDISLPVARGGFHGLYIEMKTKGGRVQPEQKQWRRDLIDEGYRHAICWSWEEAVREITEYLGLGKTGPTR